MTIIEIHSHATPFMFSSSKKHNRALENKIECHIRKFPLFAIEQKKKKNKEDEKIH